MADTTYQDYITPAVNAEWLNEINDHVWHDTPVAGSAVHAASSISNTPAGGISSTDVQGALNELDSEKASLSSFSDSTGSTLVGFIQAGTGAVARTAQSKLREWVTPEDYGAVGDGSTDDTTKVQAAINYAITTSKHLRLPGQYKVSKVVFDGCNGLLVECSGNLFGATSGTYEAVLVIKNSSDVTFTGRLGVSAMWNSDYTSAIAIYTDNGTQANNLHLDGLSPIGARLGWKIGRTSEPDALVSEITIKGGFLYGCPSAVEAIGSQTVVSFVGSQLITGTNGGSGAWLTLPRVGVKSVGAYINVVGGEVLMTDVTTGNLFQVEPSASVAFGNMYGNVIVDGVVMESASPYCAIANPNSIGSLVAGKGFFSLKGCGGFHSQNAFSMINIAADYTGKVVVLRNNFYAGVARTFGNIFCSGTSAEIWMDDVSFGKNFVQGLSSITSGIAHFDYRQIFYASNADGQTFTINTPTAIKWTTVATSQDYNRFTSNYSVSTGVFTVPAGGLKSVTISWILRTNQPTQPLDTAVYINGSFFAPTTTMMGGASNSGFARGTVFLGDLAAGTAISVHATQLGASSASNGGTFENVSIMARN